VIHCSIRGESQWNSVAESIGLRFDLLTICRTWVTMGGFAAACNLSKLGRYLDQDITGLSFVCQQTVRGC